VSTTEEDAREFVTENRDLLREVLRFSQDPYSRACALVLLKHGGTERDLRAIEEELSTVKEGTGG
jgi:hypothetical protein